MNDTLTQCLYCGERFEPQRKTAKYCTSECKRDYNRNKHKIESDDYTKVVREPLEGDCPSPHKIDREYFEYRSSKGLETKLDDATYGRKCISCKKNFKTRLDLMRYCSFKCHSQF